MELGQQIQFVSLDWIQHMQIHMISSSRSKYDVKFSSLPDVFVGTKGVSQVYHLSFDDNKVLKIINWIC